MIKDEIMKAVADRITDNIKTVIHAEGMTYTGQLENSFIQKKDGEDIIIGSTLVYAAVMERGRLPGKMPPVKVLFPWVFQKITAASEKKVLDIAYAVAKKIEQKGIEGRHYIKQALFKLEKESQR